MEEKIEKKLIELTDFKEQNKDLIESKTLNYSINDFNINNLPEENPVQTVLSQFSKKRQIYMSQVKKGIEPTMNKPKLEDFLKNFQSTVKEMNRNYKKSKIQFEKDIKFFKNCEVEDKENQTKNPKIKGPYNE